MMKNQEVSEFLRAAPQDWPVYVVTADGLRRIACMAIASAGAGYTGQSVLIVTEGQGYPLGTVAK
jgi:hypothetical protein